MKRAYYYLFYKLYKFSEAAPSRWMSDWKAELAIDVLELFVVFTVLDFYTICTERIVNLENTGLCALLYISIIAIPNYFIFHHNDQWKGYVHEFDKWPKNKNTMGTLIVWCIIILIITTFFISIDLVEPINLRLHHK
ncbi:MAG: hypothetical protein RJA07_1132 [Bacteroidota bacterium]|jgi:hypothetical protein